MTANEVFYYEVPSLIVLGSTVSIFANYATITMHSSIPMPYDLMMPVVSAVSVVGLSVLFPPASEMHEDSKCFLAQAKTLAARKKHMLRVVKAQRSFRFNFGCLFTIKMSTYITFLKFIVEWTINAILV